MTTNRHEIISQILQFHADGKLTDLEMVGELALAVERHPCSCLACSE